MRVIFLIGSLARLSANVVAAVNTENASTKDVFQLSMEENMDNGKTHAALIWVHQHLPDADYVGKSDLDTYINFPILLTMIPPVRVLPVDRGPYGLYLGQSHCYAAAADHPKCAEGGFYMLSSSLVRWIALNESLCANRRHQSCPKPTGPREGKTAEDLVTCKQVSRRLQKCSN